MLEKPGREVEKNSTEFQYVLLAWHSSSSYSITLTSGQLDRGPQTHGVTVERILLRHLVSPKLLWFKNSINLARLLFIKERSVDVCIFFWQLM